MSPEWTRAKIVIEFLSPPMACHCLPCVQELHGCQRIGHPILIEIGLILIALHNENHVWHVLIYILGHYYLKM